MSIKYASIVPLIGGQVMGMQEAFGGKPEWLMSFEGFQANDEHARVYYDGVPYHIYKDKTPMLKEVDVISTTCPCAGLSSLSTSSSSDSKTNDWMVESAKIALRDLRPKVFWGENAPRLASKMGKPVVDKLRKIAKEHGYTFSLIKTKSLVHGLPQVRDRSFYFFWKDNKVPKFDHINTKYKPVEDLIRNAAPCDVLTNTKVPSADPLYRFILEEMHGGMSHKEFVEHTKYRERSFTTYEYIESSDKSYLDVASWLQNEADELEASECVLEETAATRKKYERLRERMERVHEKLANGKNIMRHGVMIPRSYTGAFVGHVPMSLTHPDIDRHITVREALDMMAMPQDFELQGGVKNLNHICQNVPVTTARDMAKQIAKYLCEDLEMIPTSFMIQNNKTDKIEHIEIQQTSLFT